jgi:hypothetical protein
MATTERTGGEQGGASIEATAEWFRENPDDLRQFSEGVVASIERMEHEAHGERVDLDGTDWEPADFEVGSPGAVGEQLLDDAVAGENQVITAHANLLKYWFVIPESAMKEFETGGDVVATFMTLGGAAIAASGGALGPVVLVVAAYVAAELALMKAVDRGKGVYLTGYWAAPGIIVPTPI